MSRDESARAKPSAPAAQPNEINTGSPAVARNDRDGEDAHVPLFGSWRKAYATVIVVFAADVALFYAISRFFA